MRVRTFIALVRGEVWDPRYLTCPEWRFYEAEFVKTRCENSLCCIFCSFLPTSDNNSPLWLWCLIICDGVYAAMIKRQSQLLLPARNVVGSRRTME